MHPNEFAREVGKSAKAVTKALTAHAYLRLSAGFCPLLAGSRLNLETTETLVIFAQIWHALVTVCSTYTTRVTAPRTTA